MKANIFVEKLVDIAKNYKTLYVMGCFGAPMTAANKKRYTGNHEYNRQSNRTAMITPPPPILSALIASVLSRAFCGAGTETRPAYMAALTTP